MATPGWSRPVPPSRSPDGTTRRAILGGATGALVLIAGCGGDGGGSPTAGTSTRRPTTTRTTELRSSWSVPPYRSTPNGSLIIAVTVRNPTENRHSATLRVFFTLNDTLHERTTAITLEPNESEVFELTFSSVQRGAVENQGVGVQKELT